MSAAALLRLREIVDERARLDAEERALIEQLANDREESVAEPEGDSSSLVSLRDAATALDLSYDATRMRAARENATVRLGERSFVWRTWIDRQLVRSVRSVAVRSEHVVSSAGKVEPR